MRKNILLILAIVLFTLTTAVVLMIPVVLSFKLDPIQWTVITLIGLKGYFASYLYYSGYKEHSC
jgi:hypothetical protein